MIDPTYIFMLVPIALVISLLYYGIFWSFPSWFDDFIGLHEFMTRLHINIPTQDKIQLVAKSLAFHLFILIIVAFFVWLCMGINYISSHPLYLPPLK